MWYSILAGGDTPYETSFIFLEVLIMTTMTVSIISRIDLSGVREYEVAYHFGDQICNRESFPSLASAMWDIKMFWEGVRD